MEENRMITLPEGYVAITTDEYVDLLADSQTLIFLINGMLDKAHLSYSGEYLSFDDNAIKTLLRASPYAHRYRVRLEDLQEVKAKEEQDGTGTDID